MCVCVRNGREGDVCVCVCVRNMCVCVRNKCVCVCVCVCVWNGLEGDGAGARVGVLGAGDAFGRAGDVLIRPGGAWIAPAYQWSNRCGQAGGQQRRSWTTPWSNTQAETRNPLGLCCMRSTGCVASGLLSFGAQLGASPSLTLTLPPSLSLCSLSLPLLSLPHSHSASLSRSHTLVRHEVSTLWRLVAPPHPPLSLLCVAR